MSLYRRTIMDQFKTGYRIIMLINREKESKENDRRAVRCITKNIISFNNTLKQLREMKQARDRIYCTVNERDMYKAIRIFKRRQLDNDYASSFEKENFYCDIDNRFISCLQNPEARLSRNFLIDLDSQDMKPYMDVSTSLEKITKILHWRETPNGFHFVTKPFDSTKFHHPKATILKDGMLFIE